VLTTDRGLARSVDRGASWEIVSDNVPIHLEALPLVRDPANPDVVYAGFSLRPYDEIWRAAAERSSALARLDPIELAGGIALLAILALGAAAALRVLARRAAVPTAASTRPGRGPD
jgi:hypothetical protein